MKTEIWSTVTRLPTAGSIMLIEPERLDSGYKPEPASYLIWKWAQHEEAPKGASFLHL